MSPLSLWNARASGMSAEEMESTLFEYAKYDVPGNVLADLRDYVDGARPSPSCIGCSAADEAEP